MVKKVTIVSGLLALLAGCSGWPWTASPTANEEKPVALMQLIEFDDIQGLRNWAHALDERGLKALLYVQADLLEEYPDDFRWLADQGHEVGGGYAQEPFWDVAYETQLEIMRDTKEAVETVTGKTMRVFGSRYFAYDENTLRAADALGIEYLVARGTSDVEVLIYDPDEYHCKVISVSNVTFEDMGRGSLCDYSLWARGATAADFDQILQESIAKRPKRLMIASHAYLGGMKQDWWSVYEKLLDSDNVRWAANFDEWVQPANGVNIQVPLSLIPVNREVQYDTPQPAVPLDELQDVDQMYNPCGAP